MTRLVSAAAAIVVCGVGPMILFLRLNPKPGPPQKTLPPLGRARLFRSSPYDWQIEDPFDWATDQGGEDVR